MKRTSEGAGAAGAADDRRHHGRDLARRGYTTRDIAAAALGIGERTARTHLENLMAKVGAARKSDLVRLLGTE